MNRKSTIYIASWLIYSGFSFFMFPVLSITVMLASIPLTMLGGWLFCHRGALGTTLLTIPYHFALLTYYSDIGGVVLEAFNPFGIISQLVFSHSTALLKVTRDRYIRLNNSLEELVEERTSELQQLTNYLLKAESQEYSNILATLLETPLRQLMAMHGRSLLLTEHLESMDHEQARQANSIAAVIDTCIKNLQALESYSETADNNTAELEQSIRTLSSQLTRMSGVEVEFKSEGNWNVIESEKNHHLCRIVHEAVSNALQHAQPSRIEIGIEQIPGTSTLYIENNGTPLTGGSAEGMGLPLMNYRASKIGAKFSIRSKSNNDTRVECIIPHKA
jgi:signal transduction histidine kinase